MEVSAGCRTVPNFLSKQLSVAYFVAVGSGRFGSFSTGREIIRLMRSSVLKSRPSAFVVLPLAFYPDESSRGGGRAQYGGLPGSPRIVAHECAHVEENAARERQFPGILLDQTPAGYVRLLERQFAEAFWCEYAVCRVSRGTRNSASERT